MQRYAKYCKIKYLLAGIFTLYVEKHKNLAKGKLYGRQIY